MVTATYPPAVQRPVTYATAAIPFMVPVRGWVLHVQAGDGSPWALFEQAPAGNRRFSHLWFGKDGTVEQYQGLDRQSWAQVLGNASWWSCETEGLPGEALTLAQVKALADWHVWSLTADAVADVPTGTGIGTHQMGGAAWGGHACPGPTRSSQRAAIISTAQALRSQDMPVTPADAQLIADTIQTRYEVHAPDGSLITRDDAIGRILAALHAPVNVTVDVHALAAAVVAALPVQGALTAAQVADELARRLQS